MIALWCKISGPSRTMCFRAGRPSNQFKVLFTLSFLIIRAANAIWCHGKLSARHTAAFEFKLTLDQDTATEPRHVAS